jgi:hypothetical protein
MSEHWEVFPCTIGEHQAFVAYDHGLSETIDGLAPTSLLKIKATLQAPTDNGMPSSKELARLNVLEDGLEQRVRESDGLPVGRVTVAGLRVFYYYVDLSDADAQAIVDDFAQRSGYELRFTLKEDAGREGYWQDLYPSDDEKQLAADLRTVDELRQRGDDLDIERRVEHWAYFSDAQHMDSFVTWLGEQGFVVDSASPVNPADTVDSEHTHRVQFHHTLAPNFANIADVTVELSSKARALDGDYDGWETQVQGETADA